MKPKLLVCKLLSGSPLIISVACSLGFQSAQAASATWNGTTDALWSTPANWSANPVPGTGNTATFNNPGNANVVLDLGAGVAIGSVLFDTGAAAYTIGSGAPGSQVLTLDDAGGITMNSGVITNQLFNSALVLGTSATTQTFNLTNESTTNSLTVAGGITGFAGVGVRTLSVAGAGNTTLSGIIGNGAGGTLALTKSGNGTLTLGGINTYTGGTSVNAGILQITQTAGAAATGTINIGGGNFQINQVAANFGYAPAITLTAAGSTFSSIGAGQINHTGTITGNGNALNVSTATARLYINGAVTGVSQFNVTAGAMGFDLANGAGVGGGAPVSVSNGASLYFANTSNALTGNITLNGGTGQAAVGAIYFESAGATLQTAILSGTLNLASGTSSIGNNSTNVNTNVIERGKVTGAGSLTKTGVSILTLANAGNDYTGTTTISAGTLQISNGGTIATSANVVNNGTLLYNQSNTQTYANVISGTGGLTKTGAGAWTLSGANSYAGTTLVSGGILNVGDGTTGSLNALNPLTFGGTSKINFNEAAGGSQSMGALTFNAIEGTVQSTYGGSGNTSLTFSNLVARPAGGSGNFVTSGGTNGSSNKIVFTQVAGLAPVTGGLLDKGYYYNGADFAAYDAGGFVRGLAYGSDTNAAAVDTITTGNHVKLTASPAARVGDSLLTLNLAGGGVDYTMSSGSLTLAGGGLIKSGGGAVSTISGGTNVTATGAVELVVRTDTAGDLLTISTPITGSTGGLTKSGAGTLTLSGTGNSYTGATTIDNGTLTLSGTYTGGSAFTVRGGGTLNVNGASNGNIIVNATTGNVATANVSAAVTLANSNTITVGNTVGGTSIMNIGTGANISGGNQDIRVGNAGFGVINQTAGSVTPGVFFVAGINAGSVGIWNLSGGTVQTIANMGGTLGANTPGATGVFNVTGTGSYTSNLGTATQGLFVGENATGILNVSGSGALTLGGGIAAANGLRIGHVNVATAVGVVNLGAVGAVGGLITTNRVSTAGTTATSIFNFHGGTLKATGTNVTTAFMTGLTSANVYAEGGTIDNNAQAITIGQALLAPAGKGISSIAVTGGTNYAAAPYVAITGGGGTGATAVANIDGSGNITGITMTNPGTGYTGVPTVNLIGGNGNFTSAVPTTTTNASSGLLTFSGSGTTTLTGGSTYNGNVLVSNGTLAAGFTNIGNPATGALGNETVAGRTVTVNSGAALSLAVNDVFGNQLAVAANLPSLVIKGTMSTVRYNQIGALTLNGATLSTNNTVDSGNYQNFQFLGDVTVGGSTPSTISSTGAANFNGNHLGTATNFNVANVTGDATADLIVSAPLRNQSGNYANAAGALTKSGAGTMTLTGANTYTGATTITEGKLILGVGGSIASSSIIDVQAGATLDTTAQSGWALATGQSLKGAGTLDIGLGNTLTMGAGSFLAPGASPGTFGVNGSLAFAADSTFSLEIAPGTLASDRVNVGGGLIIDPAAKLALSLFGSDTTLPNGTKFVVMDYTTTWNGTGFSGFADDTATTLGLNTYLVDYNDAAFDNSAMTLTVIPEPQSLLLGSLGLLGLLRRRR